MNAPAGVALALFALSAACRSTTVVPAIKCADPCCEGQVMSIDCAETPNVSCTEDADPCSARAYGCADGSFYVGYPELAPSTCNDGAGAETGVFLLGDGGPPPDSPDADGTVSD